MSEIYIAAGHISAHDLLSDSSNAVRNWPRQDDQATAIEWSAGMPSIPTRNIEQALSGRGKTTSGLSGSLEILAMTPQMREWVYENIYDSEPYAPATIQLYHPLHGWSVWQVYLSEPFASGLMVWQTSTDYSNIALPFTRGRRMPLDVLLLQSGDHVLLQSGQPITLESA